jgi:hypothetical protein
MENEEQQPLPEISEVQENETTQKGGIIFVVGVILLLLLIIAAAVFCKWNTKQNYPLITLCMAKILE